MSSQANYSHQGEVEKTDAYTLSVVKTADTGMLGLVYALAVGDDHVAGAVVRSAIKRGRNVKHAALAKVLEAEAGAFLTVIYPGERLDRIQTALVGVGRDGLPAIVAAADPSPGPRSSPPQAVFPVSRFTQMGKPLLCP